MKAHRRRWIVPVVGLFVACATRSVQAQCGAPSSSCRECHEALHQGAFVATEAWHSDHAFGDFCADCHGGAPTVHDDSAHLGLVDPLGPAGARCDSCHHDRSDLVAKYSSLVLAPKPPPPPKAGPPTPPTPRATQPTDNRRGNRVLSASILCIGLASAFYVVGNEKRRRSATPAKDPHRLDRSEWSPYLAGGLLGVVVAISMAIFGHRLSGGGAYQELALPIGRVLSPRSVYWGHVITGAAHWDVPVLAGAVLGSLAAALRGRRFKLRTMPDTQWAVAFGASVPKRWLLAFGGAVLTEFAAGVAGGCTASLAVSGGAALAPGAFAFMGGMFAAGIPTAWFVYRKVPS